MENPPFQPITSASSSAARPQLRVDMDLAEYDREYNTDEVSINSSVLSEEKETYTADKVLAEYVPDGEEATMYLIKWSDYPWHR